MRPNFRAFIKGGIPFMETDPATRINATRITGWKIVLVLLYAVLAAAASSLLLWGIVTLMNIMPVYSGLPGASRYLEEHDGMILLVPVVTALIIAVLLRYTGDRVKRILRPFQGLLMINAGIPLGLEGPVSDLPFSMTENQDNGERIRRLWAVAGMTGGLAFLFGAPCMAVALVTELLITELTWIGIGTAILGGGTGMLLHYLLIGQTGIWSMPEVPAADPFMLLGYTTTGIIVGLLAMLAGKLLKGLRSLFQRLPFDQLWWPVVAAVIVGIAGYYMPETIGAGYDHIDSMLNGQITLQFLVVMIAGKLVLMSIATGSGIPGGTMAPLIVAGGAAGLLVTFLLQFAFPAVHLHVAVAALVGMSAMFAAGNRVLVSAILFAIEMTHAVNPLLPVICACVAAYTVVFLLAKKKDVPQPATVVL